MHIDPPNTRRSVLESGKSQKTDDEIENENCNINEFEMAVKELLGQGNDTFRTPTGSLNDDGVTTMLVVYLISLDCYFYLP